MKWSALRRGASCVLFLLTSMVFFANAALAGQEYFVDAVSTCSSGDPDYGTSPDCAFPVIVLATAAANDGDTIHVACGNYDGMVTLANSVKFLGAGPHCTTIRDSGSDGILVTGPLVEIVGFAITAHVRDGIHIRAPAVTTTIRNCIVESNGGSGIYDPDNIPQALIVNCLVRGNTFDGVHMVGPNYANAIWNTIITKNSRWGIYAYYGEFTGGYNKIYGNLGIDRHHQAILPGDDDTPALFIGPGCLDPVSPGIDAGDPGRVYNDPDGSSNDQGAYGGPGAVEFAPVCGTPSGPVITDLTVTPAAVPFGGDITIQGTGIIP